MVSFLELVLHRLLLGDGRPPSNVLSLQGLKCLDLVPTPWTAGAWKTIHKTKPSWICPSPRKLKSESNYLSLRAWEFPTLGIPIQPGEVLQLRCSGEISGLWERVGRSHILWQLNHSQGTSRHSGIWTPNLLIHSPPCNLNQSLNLLYQMEIGMPTAYEATRE